MSFLLVFIETKFAKKFGLNWNDPHFLLQICRKLCYFIREYTCFRPKRSAIVENTRTTVAATHLLFDFDADNDCADDGDADDR